MEWKKSETDRYLRENGSGIMNWKDVSRATLWAVMAAKQALIQAGFLPSLKNPIGNRAGRLLTHRVTNQFALIVYFSYISTNILYAPYITPFATSFSGLLCFPTSLSLRYPFWIRYGGDS